MCGGEPVPRRDGSKSVQEPRTPPGGRPEPETHGSSPSRRTNVGGNVTGLKLRRETSSTVRPGSPSGLGEDPVGSNLGPFAEHREAADDGPDRAVARRFGEFEAARPRGRGGISVSVSRPGADLS